MDGWAFERVQHERLTVVLIFSYPRLFSQITSQRRWRKGDKKWECSRGKRETLYLLFCSKPVCLFLCPLLLIATNISHIPTLKKKICYKRIEAQAQVKGVRLRGRHREEKHFRLIGAENIKYSS